MAQDDLVERARCGDTAAWDELDRKYRELAFRVAYLITRNEADAEEGAQEGLWRAYQNLDRFHPGADFEPWLKTIVINESRHYLRSWLRWGKRNDLFAQHLRLNSVVVNPETSFEEAEKRRKLVEVVNRLPKRLYLVVVCRYFADLSEADTAKALGIPVGTVKSRLSRALKRLQEQRGELV